MAADTKPKPVSNSNSGGKKIKPSKQNYNNSKQDKVNKAIRQERHKKRLKKMAERKAKRTTPYVLPSKVKRFMKRVKKSRSVETTTKE